MSVMRSRIFKIGLIVLVLVFIYGLITGGFITLLHLIKVKTPLFEVETTTPQESLILTIGIVIALILMVVGYIHSHWYMELE